MAKRDNKSTSPSSSTAASSNSTSCSSAPASSTRELIDITEDDDEQKSSSEDMSDDFELDSEYTYDEESDSYDELDDHQPHQQQYIESCPIYSPSSSTHTAHAQAHAQVHAQAHAQFTQQHPYYIQPSQQLDQLHQLQQAQQLQHHSRSHFPCPNNSSSPPSYPSFQSNMSFPSPVQCPVSSSVPSAYPSVSLCCICCSHCNSSDSISLQCSHSIHSICWSNFLLLQNQRVLQGQRVSMECPGCQYVRINQQQRNQHTQNLNLFTQQTAFTNQ
jgi:hypothetical protein